MDGCKNIEAIGFGVSPAFTALRNWPRNLFVDNCSSHDEHDNIKAHLRAVRKIIRKLPGNATDMVQPADSFVIQKIKEVWQKRWHAYKSEAIRSSEWQDVAGNNGSVMLKSPGKSFFLQLAVDSVMEVKNLLDINGMTYARKAMTRTGLSLNDDEVWTESQLSESLQIIIAKHRKHHCCAVLDPEKFKSESNDEENENANDGIERERGLKNCQY